VGDLGITALYNAQTWAWGGLPCADLFTSVDSKRVFAVTNAVMAAARLFDRRHPPLRRALLQRHALIDHVAYMSPTRRVIELAAGLSRRGAAMTADPGIDYVELDQPHVVAAKRRLLERSATGRAVLARPNFAMRAADVVRDPLGAGPAVVIAEGIAMYLARDARRALFANVRAIGDVELVFDLTPSSEEPAPGAVGRALDAAMKRVAGGTFVRDARTRDDVIGELDAAGFTDARAIAARDVARDWNLPFPDTRTWAVIFVARATAR
jgi:O-methyltransferase involved in polyketide biosynthesis